MEKTKEKRTQSRMKASVTITRDENGFPKFVVIEKAGKTLKVEQEYPSTGDVYRMIFSGPTSLIPSATDLLMLANAKRLDRIGTIEEINLLKLIEEITKVGEITNIRDLTWQPKGLIINPSFEQDFVGWKPFDAPWIETTLAKWLSKSCGFHGNTSDTIYQYFSIPIKTDWFTELAVWVRTLTANLGLNATLTYTDGTSSVTYLRPTAANTWQRLVLTKTSDKYIEVIFFGYVIDDCDKCWIDDVELVF